MSIFELTAKNNIYLGANNIVQKGEMVSVHVGSPSAKAYNIFSNPDSRRQTLEQMACRGIDLRSNTSLLNLSQWDVKQVDHSYSRIQPDVNTPAIEKFKNPFKENTEMDIVDSNDSLRGCRSVVEGFFNEGNDAKFAEAGLSGRCEMSLSFFEKIKGEMGITSELSFQPMGAGELGAYNPHTDRIELNSSYFSLVFGELVPKRIAMKYSSNIANFSVKFIKNKFFW